MKGWKRKLTGILMILLLVLGIPSVQAYATEDTYADLPLFIVAFQKGEEFGAINAFYVEDTYGTGKAYLVTDSLAAALFEDGYETYLVSENYYSEVTNVYRDSNDLFAMLEVENVEDLANYIPLQMAYEIDEPSYMFCYLGMYEDGEYVFQGDPGLEVTSWSNSNHLYFSSMPLETDLMIGGVVMSENFKVVGEMSYDTDGNGVLVDFTTLPFPEETAIEIVSAQESEPVVEEDEPIVKQEEPVVYETNEEDDDFWERMAGRLMGAILIGGVIGVIKLIKFGFGFIKNIFTKGKKQKDSVNAAGKGQNTNDQGQNINTQGQTMRTQGQTIGTQSNDVTAGATMASTSNVSAHQGYTIPLQPEMTSQPAWQIRGTDGLFKGRVIPVKGIMLVGRNPQAQISYPIDTKGISGNHCQLIEEEGYISLADLESSYGTYLGQGIRLEAGIQYRLEEGDIFYLANPSHSFCLERVK